MARSEYSGVNLIMKKRLIAIFVIIFGIMILLLGKVGWIQIVKGAELQKLAVEQWTNDVKIDAKRGRIFDRNGNELAISASCERVDVYMKDIITVEKENKDIKKEIASKLSKILGDKEEDILKRLNMTLSNGKPLNSVTMKRRIEKSQADEIRKLKLPGIIVSEDSKRYYPNGNFLSSVLGFTNIDGIGQEGLERKYEIDLKGTPGRVIMEADRYRRELPYNISRYDDPVNGNDLILSIDESIQLYVEKALDEALVLYKAKAATAIVMDPISGEVLAMANKPDYNPNDPRNMKDYKDFQDVIKSWNNKAVVSTFEPGSIFKVVTGAAAMSEGLVNDNDTFVCNGSKVVGGRTIRCWKTTGHGVEDFAQIFQNSCNVGFMTLAERLGRDKFYKYIDAFGLGKTTNIDVNFEETGYTKPINKVGPVELANMSFGQGIVVTPIQMASIFSAIANDGKMMEPHIVKKIQRNDIEGNVIEEKEIQPKITRNVIDENTAKKLRGYLEKVISIGGGKNAYVPGYHIAGKTGTAQKAENGIYVPGKYISSFVGMAPADNPKIVVLISIDEPDPSNYYASQTAAPLAGEIFRDIFISLNIPPDNENEAKEIVMPNIIGKSQINAVEKLKSLGLLYEIKGSGTVVSDINPMPGIILKSGSKVVLYMGNGQTYNDKVIVPDLEGKDIKEASNILESLGLKVNSSGQGQVIKQSPQVGQKVVKGTFINVELDLYRN